MNLINDRWIPVVRANGAKDTIAPWQVAETDNPVVEIAAPRPDFHGALYQFLIGLLQTTLAPSDEDQWLERWEQSPEPEMVRLAFAAFQSAFELLNLQKPAFMQDYNLCEGEKKPLASLLIDAPGGKTLKDNLDHFVKGGVVNAVCHSCAAAALFTLQINAPSGGSGHRVGLRGGGPLTTLLMPGCQASLWKKLWLNVLIQQWNSIDSRQLADTFPWLAPTRVSDKAGFSTLPEDAHPLQMYWAMPRRIRLQPTNEQGICSLCAAENTPLVSEFVTRNYGANYEGPWLHPLTPYKVDPKHEKPPLSLKGRQGGLGYRHWLGINLQDKTSGDCAATVMTQYQILACDYPELSAEGARLWCFGYDMDNMKARCWYDQQLPVLAVSETYREVFTDLVTDLLTAANEVVAILRSQVKAAWFDRPKDAKGDMTTVDASFWEATEPLFYQLLHVLATQPTNTSFMPAEVARQWLNKLRRTAENLFDHWVLAGEVEDLNVKRVIQSRRKLVEQLRNNKTLKNMANIAKTAASVPGQEVL